MLFNYSRSFNDGVTVARWSVEEIHIKPNTGKVAVRLFCYISEAARAAGKDPYREVNISFDMDPADPLFPPLFNALGPKALTAIDLYFNPPAAGVGFQMWVHNGIYYRIRQCVLNFEADQMLIDYVGYANSNLNQPVSMKTYITSIKEFKNETDLEQMVLKHQEETKK